MNNLYKFNYHITYSVTCQIPKEWDVGLVNLDRKRMTGKFSEHDYFIGGHLCKGRQKASENREPGEKNRNREPRR